MNLFEKYLNEEYDIEKEVEKIMDTIKGNTYDFFDLTIKMKDKDAIHNLIQLLLAMKRCGDEQVFSVVTHSIRSDGIFDKGTPEEVTFGFDGDGYSYIKEITIKRSEKQ